MHVERKVSDVFEAGVRKQAGAQLGQAQVKLDDIFEVVNKAVVKV